MDQVLRSISLFVPDTSPPNDTTFMANKGRDYRRRVGQKSRIIDLMGHPFFPPFETTKLIPSTARWQFDLTLNSSKFLLKFGSTEGSFKLQLLKAELLITRLELSPSASSSISSLIQRERRLVYPFIDYRLNNYSLPKGQKEFRIQNTTLSSYPKRMYIFMVSEKAMLGDHTECPFW